MQEGLVKGLLRRMLRIFPIIRYPLRQGENSLLVTKNHLVKGLRISALCGSHKRAVGVFVYADSKRRSHESEPPPLFRHKGKRNELARQPKPLSNGMEYRPLMVRAQNPIPVVNGYRFHRFTPVSVPPPQ